MITLLGAAARLAELDARIASIESAVGLYPLGPGQRPFVLGGVTAMPALAEVSTITTAATLANVTTLQTVLSVVGTGWLHWASADAAASVTSRVRLVIEVDGVSIFDSEAYQVAASPRYTIGAGLSVASSKQIILESLVFRETLVIKAAKSVAIDAVTVRHLYRLANLSGAFVGGSV